MFQPFFSLNHTSRPFLVNYVDFDFVVFNQQMKAYKSLSAFKYFEFDLVTDFGALRVKHQNKSKRFYNFNRIFHFFYKKM